MAFTILISDYVVMENKWCTPKLANSKYDIMVKDKDPEVLCNSIELCTMFYNIDSQDQKLVFCDYPASIEESHVSSSLYVKCKNIEIAKTIVLFKKLTLLLVH